MIRVITGEMFNTSFGKIIAYNEQDIVISVGEIVNFDGNDYKVKKMIPPSVPDGKWSILI